MEREEHSPLFETRKAEGIVLYRLFAVTVFLSICSVWAYRLSHMPSEGEDGRWIWIGLFGSELWFGLYWVFAQSLRWNPVYRCTFKNRLTQRYEDALPGVDIFVCTANPMIEPPIIVINTVLSVMAFDYPSKKLSVYLSDDGGSNITFYALLEASKFARLWIPYCKKFNAECGSPAAYFAGHRGCARETKEFLDIEKLYEEMEERIKTAMKLGRIPEEARLKHKGFSKWDSHSSPRDHDTILQILIDGKDPTATDISGFPLPTLVYLSREKRPRHPHHFKAGAINALLRVSSKISNGGIILTLDCDMYSNNSQSVRDALCFFMDESNGQNIAFVQFPQCFENLTNNDIYSGSSLVEFNVEYHGSDGFGGTLYNGTGCFHRRDALCGRKFTKDCKFEQKKNDYYKIQQSKQEIEEEAKPLASCTYEQNTQWGNKMGLIYGCLAEDAITGLSIQCRGWKSVYLNPERKAFLGIAPITLSQTLVQHKRWCEGDFQISLSKCSPAWHAHGKISLGLQLGYCYYCLWAPTSLATAYYIIIPSFCLLKGISLFPQVSSLWLLPFGYLICAICISSLVEFLWCGGRILGWWNSQRIWLYKRTSSSLFAFIDTILKMLGFTDLTFIITDKVADADVSQRYEKEIIEFGTSSPLFTILATLAMLYLFCFVEVVKKLIMDEDGVRLWKTMPLQVLLCGVLVLINFPIYQALFLRNDEGRLPSSLAFKSFGSALFACISFTFLY